MITIENISKFYGTKKVLKEITLSFQKGKVYGIVGENGSGKTTLFRCISGMTSCKGIIKSEYTSLRNCTGFLETEPYFLPKITGYEYLRLLCNSKKIKNINIQNYNIFNLPLEKYCTTYSTGMKKKLAFLGVLLQKNNFLILDEPFNGVDIHSNLMITEIIRKLQKLNKTILISSHIFATLSEICDEIHHIKQGSLVESFYKKDFYLLEEKMKSFSIGDIVDKLNLEN